jgi:hypothetical protein
VAHHTSNEADVEAARWPARGVLRKRAWFLRMGLREQPKAARVTERIVEALVMKGAAAWIFLTSSRARSGSRRCCVGPTRLAYCDMRYASRRSRCRANCPHE